MEKDPLNKKLQTKIFLGLYFGVLLLVFLSLFLSVGKIYWEIMLYISLGWLLFLGFIAGITIFWMKKNPKKVKKINKPKNLRVISWITLFYGVWIIIKNIYYFENLKLFLLWVFMGLFLIIWAIYYLKKNKK